MLYTRHYRSIDSMPSIHSTVLLWLPNLWLPTPPIPNRWLALYHYRNIAWSLHLICISDPIRLSVAFDNGSSLLPNRISLFLWAKVHSSLWVIPMWFSSFDSIPAIELPDLIVPMHHSSLLRSFLLLGIYDVFFSVSPWFGFFFKFCQRVHSSTSTAQLLWA